MNILFSFLTLFLANHVLIDFGFKPLNRFLTLVLLVFTTPLPALTYTGMEHIFFLFLIILLYYLAYRWMDTRTKSLEYGIIFTAVLIATTRYEGFSSIVILCIFLCATKECFLSFKIMIISLIPHLIFGTISLINGSAFLPNTSIKVETLFKSHILNQPLGIIFIISMLFIFLILAVFLFLMRFKTNNLSEKIQFGLILLCGMVVLHLFFGRYGFYYRYESYLIGFGVLILAIALNEAIQKLHENKIAAFFLSILLLGLLIILGSRSFKSFNRTIWASKNIYEQQYQMAQFVRLFYPNDTIACNDIGAISFYNDRIRILDLAGLASIEVIRLSRNDHLNRASFKKLVENSGAPIAIIYERWFSTLIPSEWIKVAEWEISHNVTAGDSKVSFYAIRLDEKIGW